MKAWRRRGSRGNIVVLRSFGKFFGLAGLTTWLCARRAAACGADLRQCSAHGRCPGRLLAVGARRSPTRQLDRNLPGAGLARPRKRLDAMLSEAGCEIVGGTALFRLVRTPAADELFVASVAPEFSRADFPSIRVAAFGLPADEPEWQRLQLRWLSSVAAARLRP